MNGINKVILIGNVGKDPECETQSPTFRVAKFSVATKKSWKDKATQEWKDKTQWHNVQAYNYVADAVQKNIVRVHQRIHPGFVKIRMDRFSNFAGIFSD